MYTGDHVKFHIESERGVGTEVSCLLYTSWLTGQTAQEAVGTLIAGGEYPDMIDGGDGMKQLYDAGALVALDLSLIHI